MAQAIFGLTGGGVGCGYSYDLGRQGCVSRNRFKATEMLASDNEGTRICYYTTQRRWRVCPGRPGRMKCVYPTKSGGNA